MEWQPIETAPKDGTEVLILHGNGNLKTVSWFSGVGGMWVPIPKWLLAEWHSTGLMPNKTPCIANPTDWMPLPPAPETTT